MNVTRVPGATVIDFGDTPAEVIVNVVPLPGVGVGTGVGVGLGVGAGVGDGVGDGAGAGVGAGLGAVSLPLLPQPVMVKTQAATAATIRATRDLFIARTSS
jgi:hypothetical protein